MSEEIKKALTVKTGQKTSYDIYLEENFDGITEAVKVLEPENRKKAGAYTRDVIIGMLEKLQEEAGK